MTGLMPIGAFARLARLTVKAVRHYDAEGLLVPAEVDPGSGYRYYRADQVRTATTIAVLRGLDVPLAAIREVLTAGDAEVVTAVLGRERERLRVELARREEALRGLDGLLASPGRVHYDVVLADRDPQAIGGVSGRVRADALERGVGQLCLALARTAPPGTPFVGVYPLDLDDDVEVTVGVPVAAAGADLVLPGGPWAATLHVGPFTGLPLAYTALLEHVRERGHVARGPFTETYLADPSTSTPDELVTRLAVALET